MPYQVSDRVIVKQDADFVYQGVRAAFVRAQFRGVVTKIEPDGMLIVFAANSKLIWNYFRSDEVTPEVQQ